MDKMREAYTATKNAIKHLNSLGAPEDAPVMTSLAWFEEGYSHGLKAALSQCGEHPSPSWIPCEQRLPTEEDADWAGRVWFTFDGEVLHSTVEFVRKLGKDHRDAQWQPTGLQRPAPPRGEE